ncbi:uroporphyrinogen-III synthase [Ensifer soli]|uniref:uroporphyrinogen-III synthase n=1 Tax=Ciceribacter sp. sgz301302 TaxID=3342379 RepID=UPI0035B8763B
MRVLVTRPQPAAGATAARLRSIGHEAVVVPLTEAVPDLDALRRALSRPHGAIAATSAEAARTLAGLGHAVRDHLRTPLYAVGGATADAFRALGFCDVRVGPGDGAGLARRIAGDARPAAPLLYLAGAPRAKTLEDGLLAAAIAVETVACYRMKPRDAAAELAAVLAEAPVPAVLLYSAEGARLFAGLLAGIAGARHPGAAFCLSRSVAEALGGALESVVIAERPDEDSLLSRLGMPPPASMG